MKQNNLRSLILSIPRSFKKLIVIILDVSLSCFAVWLSYYLRTGDFLPLWERVSEHNPANACIISIVIFVPIFISFNLYKTVFRYSGSKVILTIIKAFAVYSIFYATIFTVIGVDGVPRTIGIIQPLIFLLLVIFSRLFAFYFLGDTFFYQSKQNKKTRILIFGTNKEARQLMIALTNDSDIDIVGFVDEDLKLHGHQVNGLTVYSPANIKNVIAKKSVDEIILVLSHVNRRLRNEMVQMLREENITLRTLPSYSDFMQGRVNLGDIRELSVEDILGREPVKPDTKLMRLDITNKVVMVTGAGGSIGSELSRQIYKLKPKRLILFENSEFALYTILEELKALSNPANRVDVIPRLGSISNETTIQNLLKELKPETIFNAAAYKHVPIVEINKLEGLNNNIFGTLVLTQSAIKAGVKKFILISSDKAVRPTNIMGASKRIAEMILQALSAKQNKTNFAIVRFGNVLDSSGSVVPLFKSQIKSGGPVTVTHPDINRYFMTVSEAAELVIQAGAMVENQKKIGLSSPIYLLDMGKPIRIYDLAKLMIELSGLTVFDEVTCQGNIQIKFTGLRPGEKLYEELLINDNVYESAHRKIKYARENFLHWSELDSKLSKIANAIKVNDEKSAIKILREFVTGFNPKKE